jgi:diaminohydroxyphosphoribosylaminopyrimidine deaminase/5-amino-6-(5-phosphoribosylamino)uracil reductase
MPKEAQVFTDEHRHRTFVITHDETPIDFLPPQQVIRLSSLSPFPFEELYQKFSQMGIHSLWLEGGSNLHSLFLAHKQVTKLQLYLAPKIMGQGINLFDFKLGSISDLFQLRSSQVELIGLDIKITGFF